MAICLIFRYFRSFHVLIPLTSRALNDSATGIKYGLITTMMSAVIVAMHEAYATLQTTAENEYSHSNQPCI